MPSFSSAKQQAKVVNPDNTKKWGTSGVYDLPLFRNGQRVGALPEEACRAQLLKTYPAARMPKRDGCHRLGGG